MDSSQTATIKNRIIIPMITWSNIKCLIQRYSILAYFIFSYIVSLSILLPLTEKVNEYVGNVINIPMGLFLYGPTLATFATGIESRKRGVFNWRIGTKWYLVVFLPGFGIIFVNNIIHFLLSIVILAYLLLICIFGKKRVSSVFMSETKHPTSKTRNERDASAYRIPNGFV
ncbi:MAG: hypothetical protein ACFFCQ_14855 [Promethearchaeota archaeon]